MYDVNGKTAVVTGAASGMGLAMAHSFANAGMSVVLADIEAARLQTAVDGLTAAGHRAIGVPTDVSKEAQIQALAEAALDTYGAVHVVCNNAGVSPLGAIWENSVADWTWTLGVNVWGVIHGVRVFTPLMLAQGTEGHIVNTASVAGLISPPGMGVYNVTKHAVVVLTETLHHDLARARAQIRCSVVCPAYFPSGISDSDRNRPDPLRNAAGAKSALQERLEGNLKKAVASGRLSADDVAARVFEAIRDERFYVLTHPNIRGAIETRMRDILDGRPPTDPLGGR